MYYGYRVDLETFDTKDLINKFFEIGNNSFIQNKAKIETNIQRYSNDKGVLDAAKIEEDWFPHIDTDIFISHSSADTKCAIAFAGLLKNYFGLNAFVDSCLWAHSDKLLKIIDDTYSKHTDPTMYSYEKRNNSTSHVHTILSMALAKMISNTHCFMFIGSENSVHIKDLENSIQTLSPWIYLELQLSKMLKREKEYDTDTNFDSSQKQASAGVFMTHKVDFSHLTLLTANDINTWSEKNKTDFLFDKFQPGRRKHPLQILFGFKR